MIDRRRSLLALLCGMMLVLPVPGAAQDGGPRWSASWASAQMVSDGENALPAPAEDITLRQIVRLSTGGDRVRIRVSNRFGREPLVLGAATVATAVAPGRSEVEAGSTREATFGGLTGVTVPAGADYLSDPVGLAVGSGEDLAVSLHILDMPNEQTGHPGSRATSFVVQGDQTSAPALDGARTVTRWHLLSAVDVWAEATAVIAVIGDSITDGYGVPADTNQRWTDRLAERLRSEPGLEGVGVVNLGIGGNRMVRDGLGPNAAARFDRDLLGQTGVTHLIVLEGVNDLGTLTREAPASPEAHAAVVREVIQSYAQIVARARDRGLRVIGATIMPFATSPYYHPGPETEADRQAINAWIRTPGNFDAVIDFDAVTRDPGDPTRLRAEVDSGDGLHPSMDGLRIMGDAVPLDLFRPKP